EALARYRVQVKATFRPTGQRRAFTFLDDAGERTIAVMGDRLGPAGSDPLPWDDLVETDAVYFTAGDEEALRRARRARVLVATTRVLDDLAKASVPLDAVVGSSRDPAERYVPGAIEPPPSLVVLTAGAQGGTYQLQGDEGRRYA